MSQILVLCPTRELALQVAGEFGSIAKYRGLTVVPVYGGAPISKQIRQLEEGAHAVVGTPGRMLDHIRRGTLELDNIRFLVLDEADEMLSMGFEKEISAIIENIPERRQTLLFSATIPSDIQRLAQRYMNDPTVLSLSDDFIGAKEIEHTFYMVSGTGRIADLVRIIDVEDPDSALVFCNTRDDVQLVAAGLKRHGFAVDWMSSDLSQPDREVAMGRMRNGGVRFLVATDVAARGIDISHVTHVINYTFPESLEVYIHRTGRTGRMGRTGWAVSLITPRDVGNLYFLKLQYKINPIERELPSLGEVAARRESDLLNKLLADHTDSISAAHVSLARRVMNHLRGTEIVAALLEQVLGPLDEERGKEAEDHRRSRDGSPLPPAPKEEPPKRRERPKRSRPSKSSNEPEAGSDAPDESSQSEQEQDQDETPSFKEIYLSVGRRDDVHSDTIAEMLIEAGIDEELIDRIRVRDRSTFIGVRADMAEKTISALDGVTFGDRVASAEHAKRSRT